MSSVINQLMHLINQQIYNLSQGFSTYPAVYVLVNDAYWKQTYWRA